MSDFLTAQCQLAMDGPRLRPLSIRPECPGSGRQATNGAADGSDDSDDQVNTFFCSKWARLPCNTGLLDCLSVTWTNLVI